MTTERWNEQMLDQLASLARENANSIANLSHDVANLTNQVTNLTHDVTNLTHDVTNLTSEVRSLTTEVREIKNIAESNGRAILALVNYAAESAQERRQLFISMEQQQQLMAQQQQLMAQQQQLMAQQQQAMEQHQQLMAQQQQEIVGLRTETQRMLDILLNQQRGEQNN